MFKYLLVFFSLVASQVCGQYAPSDRQKIGVQNTILAKVNGNTISMIDVKKKMDLLFHRNYPNLAGSPQAAYQFYETSWRHVLTEMVDHELILADAADKEIKITDGEIREEMESRFGPNVMKTLDQIGIGYEEAQRMIKNEMVVQRMNWWFIHSKAMANVTPQDIRHAFQKYIKENPSFTEFGYQVLTLRGTDTDTAKELLDNIRSGSLLPEAVAPALKTWEEAHPEAKSSLSTEYRLKETELSESHKNAIAALSIGAWSDPIKQTSKDKKEVVRIFYLAQKIDHPAPSFEEMAPILKNELLQKATAKTSEDYLSKLRKRYRFDNAHIAESFSVDYQPFSIQ